jgi:hypothetical protein
VNLTGSSTADAFSSEVSEVISEYESKQWIANHSQAKPSGLIAHFFGHQIITQILSEPGCLGIRMYYAINDSGIPQVLLVGVNAMGQNLLPSSSVGGRVADNGNTIADISFPCPTYCSGEE